MAQVVPTSPRRRTKKWTPVPTLLGLGGIAAFLVVWQLYAVLGRHNSEDFPPPTVVIPRLAQFVTYTSFWTAVGNTLKAWLLGLIISTVLGLVVGLIIGSSRFLREATHSTIEFLRPIPAVGLIPLAALVFGPRIGSELMIIVYACFWIVLIQVLYGVTDVDKVAADTLRTMRMGFKDRVVNLTFPTLLPFLMTGVRLSATVALILAISVELLVGTPGLGHQVALAQFNGSAKSLLALVITAGVLGITINSVMRWIERRLLFWHPSVRSEVPQ